MKHKWHKEITRSYKKTILERLENDNEFWDIIFKTQYPISEDVINSQIKKGDHYADSFAQGVKFAEKYHGIGEDND